jgi:murein DD-endopeptidase MepM/ murein hydrolase activator NlpD
VVSVGSASVSIVPDARGFRAKLDAQLRNTKVQVEAVLKDAGVRQQLDELARDRSVTVNANLDDGAARARLDALTKARSVTINADADTGAAESRLAALGSTAGGAGGQISALVAAGAAIAPAIVPAAAAAAGALAAMGSGAIVGAGGIGVLVLGISGIVSAIAALKKAQEGAAAEAARNASAQVAAAQRVQAAQAGVQSAEAALANARATAADAARRAAQAVVQAQQGVRDATAQAAAGVTQAVNQEAVAERTLQQALQQETDAQHALSDARRQAKRDLQDLNMSVEDGALAERQAALNVVSARNALLSLNSGPNKATALQQQQARLDYDQALQHQKEVALQQRRLIEQQNQARRAGVNGAPGVVAARDSLAQARQGVTDAQQGVADAQAAITAARVAGAQQINKAEQNLANAEAARASQARQAAYSIAQAQQQVINQQRALRDAYIKTGSAASSSADQAQVALAKLTPEGRKLVDFIFDSLIPGFHEFSRVAQAPIAGGALDALKAMRPLVPVLKGLVGDLADAMGDLLRSAGRALGSPFWLTFFRMIDRIAGPTIKGLGTIIGNVVTGLAGITEAFAPMGQRMLDWTERLTRRFRDFGTGKTNGLGRFLDYVEQVGPLVVATIGSLFRAFGHLFVALAPIGTIGLRYIKRFADAIASIPTRTLSRVAGLIIGIVGAIKGLSMGAGIVSGLGSAIGFLASPVGLVAAAVGLMVGGFVLLYRHSARFRDLIQRYVIPTLQYLWRQGLAGVRIALREVTKAIQDNRPELEQLYRAWLQVWRFIWRHIIPLLGPILRETFRVVGFQISLVIRAIGKLVDAASWWGRQTAKELAQVKEGWDRWKTLIARIVGQAINAIQKLPDYLHNGFHDSIHWLYDHLIKPVFGQVSDATDRMVSGMKRILRAGVDDMGRIWNGLKAIAKAPVSFMINTVLNKGLIPAYNWVAGILPGVDKIKPVHVDGFAKGTSKVLPGYTPGRDVHRFYSPTAGVIDLSGGEGIARPELVAAVGPRRWDAANAAAARGDADQGVRYLGGFAAGTSTLFAGGSGRRRVWPTNTRRLSPSYPGHSGVDIAAGMGAPIYAAADGTITYTGWNHGYGQAIFEKILGSALSVVYGHTSRLIARAGQRVTAGDLIGRVGATGHATGPHLHVEINSPGPFGNAADRGRTLAWLGGANVKGGGGTVSGGGGGGLIDWVAGLKNRLAGPLDRLRELGSSPWARLVAAAPRSLASGMLGSAKGLLGNLGRNIGRTAGAAAWSPVLLTALAMNHLPVSQLGNWVRQVASESGGNPRAVQGIRDVNSASGNLARGLLQVIPPTFERYRSRLLPNNILNPLSNAYAAMNYAKDRYGRNLEAVIGHGHGYDQGGWLKPGTTIVHNDTGKPEPVFSPSQWDALNSAGTAGGRPITITLVQDGMRTFVQGVIDDNDAFRSTVGRMRPA